MITIDPARLPAITLTKGAHVTPDDGVCLMEAVAFVAGLSHTDRPACVSPVLGEMGRSLNDVLPDDSRQQLVPLIPLLPGTAGDGLDETRSYMALDWLIRVYMPTWLELAGITEEARVLRELGRIVDRVSAQQVRPAVLVGQERAAAAWAAAGAAAWDAAGAAAGAAAWDAAGAAAGAAARAAARAAAWDAAGAAAWDAAGAAARAAAWDAAWDAAGAAARAALAPTVAQLQQSAIGLYTAMVNPPR